MAATAISSTYGQYTIRAQMKYAAAMPLTDAPENHLQAVHFVNVLEPQNAQRRQHQNADSGAEIAAVQAHANWNSMPPTSHLVDGARPHRRSRAFAARLLGHEQQVANKIRNGTMRSKVAVGV
jgi:hypothetical protein